MKCLWLAASLGVAAVTAAGCSEEPERVEPAPAGYYYPAGAYYPPPAYYTEYYVVGGRYYHWHPDHRRWVEVREVPRGARTYEVRHLPERPMHPDGWRGGDGGHGPEHGGHGEHGQRR